MGDETAAFADFFARHLANRFSVTPNGAKENHKVLHAAREHRASNQPECARQVAELRGQRRADKRPGPRNGGEMVAEENPFVGGYESRGHRRDAPRAWRALSSRVRTRAATNAE